MSKRKYFLASVVVAVGAALGLFFGLAGNGQSDAWPFPSVPSADLAAQGVTLAPVTEPDSLPTSASAAAQVASRQQGKPVLGEAYMHCIDTTRVPAIDEDCWVVSLDPGGETNTPAPGFSPIAIKWIVAFVDPVTGKWVESTLGS
jgi:hypothetical protein